MSDWALSIDQSLSDRQLSGVQIYFARESSSSREVEVCEVTPPAYGETQLLVPLLHTWGQKLMATITLLLYGASCIYLWLWWSLVVHQSKASRQPPMLPNGVDGMNRPPSMPLDGWTFLDILLTLIWAMLTYESLLACLLLLRAKKPNPDLPSDPSLRVAMIVTRAPSEPFSVVQQTLQAMLQQVSISLHQYRKSCHTSWVSDA